MLTRPAGRKPEGHVRPSALPNVLQSIQLGSRIVHNAGRLNQGFFSMADRGPFSAVPEGRFVRQSQNTPRQNRESAVWTP